MRDIEKIEMTKSLWKMKPIYCVTAINKLTRQRERISGKCTDTSLLTTMRESFLLTPARKRTHIYPRIQVVQENLFA